MNDETGCRDAGVKFTVGILLALALLCLAVALSADAQMWPTPTPTPRPSRFNTPTPTRTRTPFPPTPTPWWPSPTPTVAVVTPTPTRTPVPSSHVHLEFCGAVGVTDILLNGSEPTNATWQKNKAMPVPIFKGKSGLWVKAGGEPVWSTLGDEVTICAGAACARAFFPTPSLMR